MQDLQCPKHISTIRHISHTNYNPTQSQRSSPTPHRPGQDLLMHSTPSNPLQVRESLRIPKLLWMELEPEICQKILAACNCIENHQKGGNQCPQFQPQQGQHPNNSKPHGAKPAAIPSQYTSMRANHT